MNDIERTKIFLSREADTPEKWQDLKDAVTGVRDDLKATNHGRDNKPGKWTIRYPNGDQPHNQADITFLASARAMVLAMMNEIEALTPLALLADDLSEGYDFGMNLMSNGIAEMAIIAENQRAEIKKANETITALRAEIEALKAPVAVDEPATVPPANKEAPKKRTKRTTKVDETNPETSETIETPEGALNA